MIHYTNCPVCGSSDIRKVFSVVDHTVSKQQFEILECNFCTLRFTQDVPDEDLIKTFYKSEDYISHTNTSKGIINRLYQQVRKKTMKQKRHLIENMTGIKKGALLDVGSGTGAFVNEMRKHGWQVTGLEPEDDARKIAREFYKLQLDDDLLFYKLPLQSFDVITLWHVLEHVHDLHAYVEQLKNLLKEKGKLFIAVPNYTSKDAEIYKEHWAAYDVPRHLYHFSPPAMKKLLENHGLKIDDYQLMWYDSFYICLLSSKYKSGKPNWISALFNGLVSNFKAMDDHKKCSSLIYIISK
ncbi:MAG: class I SAM-dependent methyltransferase [Bacteroidota bacterium]|nr:class I SAM-dependent methyltransferase [Bacteroidota bacterium]